MSWLLVRLDRRHPWHVVAEVEEVHLSSRLGRFRLPNSDCRLVLADAGDQFADLQQLFMRADVFDALLRPQPQEVLQLHGAYALEVTVATHASWGDPAILRAAVQLQAREAEWLRGTAKRDALACYRAASPPVIPARMRRPAATAPRASPAAPAADPDTCVERFVLRRRRLIRLDDR
jgi:hypothetical protein